jgi:hypothetical protein
MGFAWFRKKKEMPKLSPEVQEEKWKKRDVETLKAGKLASLALELTDSLIKKHGPRLAGSAACRETADDLAGQYKPFCTRVSSDSFRFHAKAYQMPLRLAGYCYIISLVLLYVGLPFSALLLLSLFLWYVWRESISYRPILENLSKKEEGKNVTAVLEPSGEVHDTLIFSGHHDSATLPRYSRMEKIPYLLHVLLPDALFVLLCTESVVQLLTEIFTGRLLAVGLPSVGLLIYLVLLTAGIPLVWGMRKNYLDEASPGAGDNLVSSAMTVELARYFDWKKKCGEPLSHTRLVFVSFDGEEAGLRGSRKWFASHKDLTKGAHMLNFDCPYYADQLKFLDKDINGKQPLSAKLSHEMVRIAKGMGYQAETMSIPFLSGGTDAAEGTRAGVESCTLTAVAWGNPKYPSVYHSREDVVDAIEKETLERSLSVAIRLTELVDGGKLYEDDKPIMEEKEPDEGTAALPSLHFTRPV